MTCASCVARVERALRAVPGVAGARVNLADETAEVRFAAPATRAALADVLAGAGYPVRETTVMLAVEGMTCAACTGRVERVLAAQPGVTRAAANLATRRAEVTVQQGGASVAELAAAVTRAGYAAAPLGAAPDHRAEDLAALTRDAWLAAGLTLPVFLAEMGGHLYPPFHHWLLGLLGQGPLWVAQFLLISAVLALPGRRFFAKGLPALWRLAPDMNSLVALGTLAAWAYSTIATFAPALLPPEARVVYFEAAGVIVALILLGRVLEARARGRAGAAIAGLIRLQPRTARVEGPDGITEQPIDSLTIGARIHIRPGERVAVDGLVLAGESAVDESLLTGESLPVAKAPGDALTGGTVNGTGALVMQATRVGADTALARIIRMVEQAQGAKLPVQALVDRITLWFVPVVLVVALLTVAVWLVFGTMAQALVAGVAVLIIACPCAMGLATPVSIMVGTGRAAELGVLFRRGDALQMLAGVRQVAFDKTGTLTEGRPVLTDLLAAPGWERAELLRLAAGVEAGSEHPLAGAILRAASEHGLALPGAAGFAARPGQGASAMIEGRRLTIGNAAMLAGVDLGDLAAEADRLHGLGRSALFLAVDGQAAGLLAVADRAKPTARAAITALAAMGLPAAMITGDAPGVARAIGAELGITRISAGVLPGAKVDAIRALGPGTAFVGDGINDAPALAAADVGIAIGTGTDVAIESADVVLMAGDPAGVATAITVSRRTMANIRQNLLWAFGYNAALIPVAAGVLVPFGGPQLSPMLAAGAMALSSVFVLTNALRLRRIPAHLTEKSQP
ncbi:copper-translocating P-type ATPase [Fertoebacter nigrum]|uniref:P-type Cu(2+) transporter n=2 Tax=Fertoeibacter niger TaxID=2656921 RepID=A0A8X8GRJ5_9RHOB|nr:copper-translocating P-type ATPase [Fertoeibacter niger]